MKYHQQLWCVCGHPHSCRRTRLYTSVYVFSDDGRATNPWSTQETIAQVCPHVPVVREIPPSGIIAGSFRGAHLDFFTTRDIQIVKNFENKSESEPQDYSCSEHVVILYNLSVGTTEQELYWTYKNPEEFAAFPTFPYFITAPNPGRSRGYTLQRVSIEAIRPSNRHDTEYTGIHRMSLDVHQQNVLPPMWSSEKVRDRDLGCSVVERFVHSTPRCITVSTKSVCSTIL